MLGLARFGSVCVREEALEMEMYEEGGEGGGRETGNEGGGGEGRGAEGRKGELALLLNTMAIARCMVVQDHQSSVQWTCNVTYLWMTVGVFRCVIDNTMSIKSLPDGTTVICLKLYCRV